MTATATDSVMTARTRTTPSPIAQPPAFHPKSLALVAIDASAPVARAEVVEFANTHYKGGIPLEEAAIASGKMRFFWVEETTSTRSQGHAPSTPCRIRVGVTAYMAKTPSLAETVKTVVHPDHRGRGLATAISQLIEDEVRRQGFKKVMTTIYVTNLPMIFIKLRQGYRFEGFHPDHEAPGLDEYSMGKLLS